jgi:hypothetical protein
MFGSVEHEESNITCHITSLAKTLPLGFNLIFPFSFSLFKFVFSIISYPYMDLVLLFFFVFGTIDVAKINNVFVLPSFVVCSCMYMLTILSGI